LFIKIIYADVMGKTMGPMIPETLTFDKEADDLSGDDFTSFVLSDSQSVIDMDGTIRAVEGYGLTPGDMELQIYRPSCGNSSCPFPPNSILCPESTMLCMQTKTCVNPLTAISKKDETMIPRRELKDLCRTSTSGPQFSEYKLVRRIKLTIVKGKFFIRLSRPRNLKPGDLLALRTRGGQIARRRVDMEPSLEGLNPDWKLVDGNPDEPLKVINSGQVVALNSIKYMIQLIMYEDLVLNTIKEYTNASIYDVQVSISTPWTGSSGEELVVKKSKMITVSEAIDRLRMRVTPSNGAVESPVGVTCILSSGSGVKVHWDFGDGSTDEDMVDVSVPNEKFTRFHNYSRPGSYSIQVKASNIQSDLSSKHTIVIQHPINKEWKLSSTAPQLLPGLVNFTLTYPVDEAPLPTDASLEIFYGDGFTEKYPVDRGLKQWIKPGVLFFQHEFPKSGKYRTMFTLTNLVSTLTLKKESFVMRRIQGLSVEMKHKSGQVIKSYGKNGDRYPVSDLIRFHLRVMEGDVERFIVERNGEIYKETTLDVVPFTTTEVRIWRRK